MALGIVLLMRFARRRLPYDSPAIEELIFSESLKFLDAQARQRSVALSTFVSLESINLLLVIRELPDTYQIPVKSDFGSAAICVVCPLQLAPRRGFAR